MRRLLPCPLRRPENLITVPVESASLPGSRAGFTAGDPRDWIPGTFAVLENQGAPVLPYTDDCDLLLAPYPTPGRETELLIEMLGKLPAMHPVVLYERDVPLVPNVLIEAPCTDPEGLDFASPAEGLRAYRSGMRQLGRGEVEALCVLPARRAQHMLRGSFLAEIHPGPGGSLQNRRYLVAAVDHQRSLYVTAADAVPQPKLPSVQRVAVVMPHFDDDVLQCGGAILQARASGAQVRVIWLTDGARGVSSVAPEESARIRQEEARTAMALLGVDDLHFLGAPETGLTARGSWTADLARLLDDYEPCRVHTVWWADNNADHFEANRVLERAWPRKLKQREIAASGLWTPLLGNRLQALDANMRAAKDKAVRAYPSQLGAVDYLRIERGLSRWYARDLPQGDSAEAFLCLPAEDYWARFRASGTRKRVFLRRR